MGIADGDLPGVAHFIAGAKSRRGYIGEEIRATAGLVALGVAAENVVLVAEAVVNLDIASVGGFCVVAYAEEIHVVTVIRVRHGGQSGQRVKGQQLESLRAEVGAAL